LNLRGTAAFRGGGKCRSRGRLRRLHATRIVACGSRICGHVRGTRRTRRATRTLDARSADVGPATETAHLEQAHFCFLPVWNNGRIFILRVRRASGAFAAYPRRSSSRSRARRLDRGRARRIHATGTTARRRPIGLARPPAIRERGFSRRGEKHAARRHVDSVLESRDRRERASRRRRRSRRGFLCLFFFPLFPFFFF
jgi:hypothetical protein